MGELTPGDGLLLKGFVDHPADTVRWSYKAPSKTAEGKPRYHLALWLGVWHEGGSTVDERLNALGWVFDPKRARAASVDRNPEGEKPQALSAQHESAVPKADAQTPAKSLNPGASS